MLVFFFLALVEISFTQADESVLGGVSSCAAPVPLAKSTAGVALLQSDISRSRTVHGSPFEWEPDELQPHELRLHQWQSERWQTEEFLQQVPGPEAVPQASPQVIKVGGHPPPGQEGPTQQNEEMLEFWSKHWSLVVAVFLMLAIVAGTIAFDWTWNKAQADLQHDSNIASLGNKFTMQLVKNLMPSINVENYQFRGMTEKASSLSMQFEEVALEIPNKGKVLESVTGEIQAGHMTAIMGPSGSGKTSFMNVLCGKAGYGTTTGKMMINKEEFNLSEYKPVIGYVPQDDVVHELLTVREQIHFSAQLRNPAGTDSHKLCNIVDDVLAVLQIEHIQRSIVGGVETRGISGGQRKRVNIGLELAAFPTLLFLDEPTSGLDSTTSMAIVRSLKKMTQLGLTIVMVIHQPRQSLMNLFDDVLLLARGGRTVYLGSAHAISPYFESLGFKKPLHENPADWYLDIMSGGVMTSKKEDFKVDMLPGMWMQKSRDGWRKERKRTPDWTDEDDELAFAQALSQEWEKAVPGTMSGNPGQFLRRDELAVMLAEFTHEQPQAEVMQEVVDRMAGEGAEEVTKEKFVDFFMGLRGVVAKNTSRTLSKLTSGFSPQEKEDDLHRVLPGAIRQYEILLRRRLVLARRVNKQRFLDFSCVAVISTLIGWLHKGRMNFRNPQLASQILIFHLGLSLLTVVSGLRVFGSNWPLWYRERSSGLNVFASFCARLTVDTLDNFFTCVMFTAVYFLLAQPETPFRLYFLPCLLVSSAMSGWAYFISAVAPPANATLVGILFTLASCGFLGDPGLASGMWAPISVTRWSVQMTYLGTADAEGSTLETLHGHMPDSLKREIDDALHKVPLEIMDIFRACGYVSTMYTENAYRNSALNLHLGYWYGAMAVLTSMALLLRILAYIGLCFRKG